MKLDNLSTIAQMEAFLEGSQAIAFAVAINKDERYQFVERLLSRFAYARLKRRDKGVVIQFLHKDGVFTTAAYTHDKAVY